MAAIEASKMHEFVSFTALFGKSYQSLDEHMTGFTNFHDNLEKVNRHNEKNVGFRLGINAFSDLSESEFISKYTSHPMLTGRPHKDFEGSPLGRY